MLFFLASVSKNLRRIAAAPWSVAIWIGVPLLVGGLLSAVMGGSGTETPKVHLLIADRDGSILSNALVDGLASDRLSELLILEHVNAAAGMAILDEGNASAMLVIPAGFQSDFLGSKPQALRLVTNPLQSILPQMAEELVRLIADFGSYVQQALGPELAALAEIGEGVSTDSLNAAAASDAVGTLASGVTRKLVRALPHLAEAPVEIEVVTTEGAREASFALLFFPGLLMMTIIFAAQGVAEDLWQEREMGTLRRLRGTPASVAAFLAARLATAALVLGLVGLPLAVIGFALLTLPVVMLPLALVWLSLAGLMLSSLASLIQVFAPTRKAAALFSMLVFFPLLLVGGSFFPFESMPESLAAFGRLTPNGVVLGPRKYYLIGTGDPGGFLPPLLVALAVTAGLTALTTWRVATTFATR